MEDEKKGNRLSRRSFLKGLGGGAIGTAVISTGLVKADPAEAYSPEVGRRGREAKRRSLSRSTARATASRSSTATRLAEVLRDQLGSHRHQDRLRPRRMRRLHGDHRRPQHVFLQPARGLDGRQRDSHHRGTWPRATSSIRCRKLSSNMTGRNAASAPRVRSCRARRCC